jgi:hypothetical protein
LAARVPDLDIFSQGLVERENGGWKITATGRVVLELIETRPTAEPSVEMAPAKEEDAPMPPLPQPAERARRRRERR